MRRGIHLVPGPGFTSGSPDFSLQELENGAWCHQRSGCLKSENLQVFRQYITEKCSPWGLFTHKSTVSQTTAIQSRSIWNVGCCSKVWDLYFMHSRTGSLEWSECHRSITVTMWIVLEILDSRPEANIWLILECPGPMQLPRATAVWCQPVVTAQNHSKKLRKIPCGFRCLKAM